MEESILISIMVRLGLDVETVSLDTMYTEDVMQSINSAISNLTQAGVGPPEGYKVTSVHNKWSDFIGSSKLFENVKDYIYLRCRLVFDPPTAAGISSFEALASEAIYRCKINVEQPPVL